MGLYQRYLLPPLIDLAMRNPKIKGYREKLIPDARGRVLEFGAGSGLNLAFYGVGVSELVALDPSEELLTLARKRSARARFSVEYLAASAEEIPLESGSIDTVVSAWTLCSVPDPLRALRDARRVLKPNGTLVFVEHGPAPDPGVQRWQHRLNPMWRLIAGGCNLDRRMAQLMCEAGFDVPDLANEYAEGPRPFTYMYYGHARPA